MQPDEALKIVNVWGIHLEYFHGKLGFLFGTCIPQSLLPYHKDVLEEAINLVAEQLHNEGRNKEVQQLQATIPFLWIYKDDEAAVIQAAKFFGEPKWRKSSLTALKNFLKKHEINISRREINDQSNKTLF